jgi:hypothetical protein
MLGVVFENVVVNMNAQLTQESKHSSEGVDDLAPWGRDYYQGPTGNCDGVHGIAIGSTFPVPSCFVDMTTRL